MCVHLHTCVCTWMRLSAELEAETHRWWAAPVHKHIPAHRKCSTGWWHWAVPAGAQPPWSRETMAPWHSALFRATGNTTSSFGHSQNMTGTDKSVGLVQGYQGAQRDRAVWREAVGDGEVQTGEERALGSWQQICWSYTGCTGTHSRISDTNCNVQVWPT